MDGVQKPGDRREAAVLMRYEEPQRTDKEALVPLKGRAMACVAL